MSAYNAEAFIEEAIYSILNQAYTNFELIIINDGSTDKTGEKILSFTDGRIKYLKNSANKGNHKSRNIAIQNAEGEFIAIMDSDDLATKNRLEIQVNYLQKNTKTDAVCGSIKTFGNTEETVLNFPENPDFISAFLFFKNCVSQPSIMFRHASFTEKNLQYKPLNYMEDYDLWFRASLQGLKFSAVKGVVLNYRISANQESTLHYSQRQENMKQHFAWLLKSVFDIELPGNELQIIAAFIATRIPVNEEKFNLLKHFLDKVYMGNKRLKIYKQAYFGAALYFFYLRLGKYYFIEHNKKPLKFLKYFSAVVYMLGLKSFYIFFKNNKGFR
jgi:glycosyltransferase involved in cell wall biosynthesis